MVIKASSGREIDALLEDLASDRAVRRDGAVARLTVIGARAVQRLLTLGTNRAAASATRASAFRALEAIADPRSFNAALEHITDDDGAVAAAAAGVVGAFLQMQRGLVALDRLTVVVLDTMRPTEVRLSVIRALADLDPSTVEPVFAVLRADADPAIAGAAATGCAAGRTDPDPMRCLNDAAAGTLPDDPAILGRALARVSTRVPLMVLQQIIEHVRVREGSERSSRRNDWMIVRAAAHAGLAGRGSRLALYDLRETIETAKEPLAVEFLTALAIIGDRSCLQPIAAAFGLATTGGVAHDDWWRRSLADAFRAIVKREGITQRQAVAKKIEKKWPGIFESLGLRALGGERQ